MSNENWIKFEDEMPKINQDIEIKYKSGKIFKSRFVIGTSSSLTGIFLLACEDYYADIKELEGWRPLKSENLIGCIECTNNFKQKEDEKICNSCFYGDKTDDWTLFYSDFPKLGEDIEVMNDDGSLEECRLVLRREGSGYFELRYKNDTDKNNIKDYAFNPYYYNKWRYKKDKRPNFSKLKEKDMLRLTLSCGKEEEIFIGFLVCMDEDTLTMSPIFTAPYPHNSFSYHKSTVKSIIKITPETMERI